MARRNTSSELQPVSGAVLNKHQQKTQVTRRKLLKAARRIFVRDGFEAARIDDIATEAGHTRGAFYAHFKTKEDLFLALLEEQAAVNLNRTRELMEQCANDDEKLRVLRDVYGSRAADKQWFILSLEFKLYALRHGRLRAKLAQAHRNIRAKIKLQTIASVLPKELRAATESFEVRRATLEGVLNGMTLERAYDPTGISDVQMVSMLHRIFDLVFGLPPERQA
jgi:AcrR family transcriptional regulator